MVYDSDSDTRDYTKIMPERTDIDANLEAVFITSANKRDVSV